MAPPKSLDSLTFLYQIVESPQPKHVCVQVLKDSEKTTCSVLSALLVVDPCMKAPQALYICATMERTFHVQQEITRLLEGGGIITTCTATPSAVRPSKGAKVVDQVVIGTSGTMKRWMTMSKVLDPTNIKIVVIDEPDRMFNQAESGIILDTKRILKSIKKCGGNCQVILFSASSCEIANFSATKKFPEADNWFPVVLEKPSHDLNCLYQISCPETRSKIIALNDRIVKAGITGTVGLSFSQTRTPDMFGEHLALLINETRCETSKRIFSKLRNQYLVDDDECIRLRKQVQDHNLEFTKGRIKDKASERRDLEAKVNGITSSTGLILDRTRAPFTYWVNRSLFLSVKL